MAGVLVDTDVIVELLRGGHGELDRIDSAADGEPRYLSVLTIAELRAGASGDDSAVDGVVGDFSILGLDLPTAEDGGRLRRQFGSSHGTGLIDAIIAASALRHGLTLVTNNRRHYPMPELELA